MDNEFDFNSSVKPKPLSISCAFLSLFSLIFTLVCVLTFLSINTNTNVDPAAVWIWNGQTHMNAMIFEVHFDTGNLAPSASPTADPFERLTYPNRTKRYDQ
eukprot:995837_1